VTTTLVYAVDDPGARALEQRLRSELPPDAEWRRVDHARFAVKVAGANLVCYRSGKVVLQGAGAGEFAAQYLRELAASAPRDDASMPFEAPTIGADEAGKGDYFGPLVVAAVYAEPAQRAELSAMGVADSKTLSDQRMFPMAERIERTCDCEVRELLPADYNDRWRADPNVNHLLADLHSDAVAALLRRHPDAEVVVDKFGDERLIADRLRQRLGRPPRRLVQVPRAEGHPAVGAASVVARVHFVEGFQRCEEESGTDLHKGAGAPVDVAAARAFAIGGRQLLARIAKLHFKNSQRLAGLMP